jgi:CRP-like cAMP-binding protein
LALPEQPEHDFKNDLGFFERLCGTGQVDLSASSIERKLTAKFNSPVRERAGRRYMQGRVRAVRRPIHNKLIAGLAAKDVARIRPHLEHIALPQHERLLRPDARTEYVYFVESGMVSLILTFEDGGIIEVGLVGSEGIVGILAGLGASRIAGEAIVQMPGSALRMRTDVLRKEMGTSPAIRQMLLRYVQALFAQITQSAACNARHMLPQRLARWLLMANDCAEADEVALTHEFLSMMIAVRRPGVTSALGTLKDAGIITAGHGRIVILNRKRLEAAACECYRSVKEEYERLLGRGGRSRRQS